MQFASTLGEPAALIVTNIAPLALETRVPKVSRLSLGQNRRSFSPQTVTASDREHKPQT